MNIHVQQKHPNGCVIACLSMITGIPYDEILDDFTGDRQSDGLSAFVYDVWLGYKGYAIINRYKYYSPLHADRQIWPCEPFADIHLVTAAMDTKSHAIVWLRDGTVLDPLLSVPSKLSDYKVINSICGIYKIIPQSDIGPLDYLHWSNGKGHCLWCNASVDDYEYHDICPARKK